jgi:hypothetical protein
MTLSIMGLVTTLSIDIQHNTIECHYAKCCRYAECRDYLNVMLSVVMLIVVMLNIVMLNVIMLSVDGLNAIFLSVVVPNQLTQKTKITLRSSKIT